MIEINEYLATFTGEKTNDKISEKELNEIIFNTMPNVWSEKEYAQGLDCEHVTFKKQ